MLTFKNINPHTKVYTKMKLQQVLYKVQFTNIPSISPTVTQFPVSQQFSQYNSTQPPTHLCTFNNPQQSPMPFPISNYTNSCLSSSPKL